MFCCQKWVSIALFDPASQPRYQISNTHFVFSLNIRFLCVFVFCLPCQYLIWELWIKITSSEYFVHFVSGSVRPVHNFDKVGVFDHFVDAFLLKGFVWSVTPFDLPWLIWILETLYCLLGLWINMYCWNLYKSYFFLSYPKKKREKGREWWLFTALFFLKLNFWHTVWFLRKCGKGGTFIQDFQLCFNFLSN